jgi:hypothetical protein
MAMVYRPARIRSATTIALTNSYTPFWNAVYPIVAVAFGRGFLIHTGLSLNEEREYKILVDIIKRLATTGYMTLARPP